MSTRICKAPYTEHLDEKINGCRHANIVPAFLCIEKNAFFRFSSVLLDATNSNIPIWDNTIAEMAVNGESPDLNGYPDVGLFDTMEDLFVKAADQMEWVCRVNSVHSRAEEIVLSELAYGMTPIKYRKALRYLDDSFLEYHHI